MEKQTTKNQDLRKENHVTNALKLSTVVFTPVQLQKKFKLNEAMFVFLVYSFL